MFGWTIQKGIQDIEHPDKGKRERAIEKLGNSRDPRAVEPLAQVMWRDTALQRQAAEALSKIATDAAIDALGNALYNDIVPEVTALLLWGIWQNQGSSGALDALLEALNSPRSRPRTHAAEVLRHSMSVGSWKPKNATEAAGLLVALGRFSEAAKLGGPAVKPLVRAAEGGDRNAMPALREIQDRQAVEPLLSVLRTYSAEMQTKLKDLGKKSRELAGVDFTHAADIRACAAVALGNIKDVRAVPALIVLLGDDWSDGPKEAAKKALVATGRQCVGPVTDALRHQDEHVRMRAASVLRDIGGPAEVEPLIAVAAHDREPAVRGAAAEALGRIADQRSVKCLMACVREVVGGLESGALRVSNSGVKALGEGSLEALEQCLKKSASSVSAEDLRAVTQLKAPEAFRAMSYDNEYEWVIRTDCTNVRQLARQELTRRGIKH